MIKIFEVDCGYYSHKYHIVADSYSEAEKIWNKTYPYDAPKSLKIISDYVYIQEFKEEHGA